MPSEVVSLIIEKLPDVKDVVRLALVSQHMKNLCYDPVIWKHLCQKANIYPPKPK